MSNRIPPSLNWLIDKRARISGEVEKTRRSLKQAQSLIDELKDLEIKLNAIDTTLQLHDIQIDIGLIKPISSNYYRLKIPHGELTKSILTCIRLYGKTSPVSKSTIVDFVIARHFHYDAEQISNAQIRGSIGNRLKNLCRDGVIERHHSPDSTKEGLWAINPKFNFNADI
ncbi:MAG: hypothetical protein CTY35_14810 [Methylotenera sp.]|uniref:hypothetical protein n=1 Tax=unclassified Methylotenera TaxID=2643294 RepID=UPI0005650FF4|nr:MULTISPECIES: hypothetical protein [unclassified Methylotenera]MDP3210111.1 hypothetical protein [Methylotenera sp.]PPC89929.1 MAG: hypothetical protein CTY35_14810 [Methylotenera sp.]